TLRYFNQLLAPKRALIGPWKHEFPDRATHHAIGFWREMTGWWDRWLKGIDPGAAARPPITIFDQPGGWRAENAWPPNDPLLSEYTLGPGGGLSPEPRPAGAEGVDEYVVEPTVGLNHLPWDWTTPTPSTPADISPDDHRALTYTTGPVPDDLH